MKWFLMLMLAGQCAAQVGLRSPAYVAQLQRPAASEATIYPTNLSGYPALAWYVAADYVTNSGMAKLPDRWVNGWDLTNVTGFSIEPKGQESTLNGHKGLVFYQTYLRSANYTSSQPHEVVFVASITNLAAYGFVFSSMNATFEHAMLNDGGAGWALRTGEGNPIVTSVGGGVTNRWEVFNAVFNGASSVIYSNHVAGATVNPGTATASGFTLGGMYNAVNFGYFGLVEMATYGTNLSSLARSNLNFYFTNKYAISQP